jgi:hypothetical protein
MIAGNNLHKEYSEILSEIIVKLTQAKKTTDSYEKEFQDLNDKIENGRIAFSKFIVPQVLRVSSIFYKMFVYRIVELRYFEKSAFLFQDIVVSYIFSGDISRDF